MSLSCREGFKDSRIQGFKDSRIQGFKIQNTSQVIIKIANIHDQSPLPCDKLYHRNACHFETTNSRISISPI